MLKSARLRLTDAANDQTARWRELLKNPLATQTWLEFESAIEIDIGVATASRRNRSVRACPHTRQMVLVEISQLGRHVLTVLYLVRRVSRWGDLRALNEPERFDAGMGHADTTWHPDA